MNRIKIISLILVLIFLLFLNLTIAELNLNDDYNHIENIVINEIDLPVQGSQMFELTLMQNYSAFMFADKIDEHITLILQNETFFNNSDSMLLNITYQIEDFHITNDTTLLGVINITNNYNENVYRYALNFLIKDDNATLIEFLPFFNESVLSNGYQIDTTQDLLPLNKSVIFRLSGDIGDSYNFMYCDSWLNCPENVTKETENTTLELFYFVPSGITPGIYERKFTINKTMTDNSTILQGKLVFNIMPMNFTFPNVDYQECFDLYAGDPDKIGKCWLERVQLTEDILREIIARKMYENFTMTKEIERLVMVGSVDDELNNLYQQCMTDRNILRNDYDACEDERNFLKANQTDMIESVEKLKKNITDSELIKAEEKKKRIKRFWIGACIVLVLLGFGIWYVIKTKEYGGGKL